MTLVYSVSANTAAYAGDAIRQPRRISSKAQAEDVRLDADRDALRAETGDPAVDQLIPARAVSLDLLAPHKHPQHHTTLAQAQAAYRDMDDLKNPRES